MGRVLKYFAIKLIYNIHTPQEQSIFRIYRTILFSYIENNDGLTENEDVRITDRPLRSFG